MDDNFQSKVKLFDIPLRIFTFNPSLSPLSNRKEFVRDYINSIPLNKRALNEPTLEVRCDWIWNSQEISRFLIGTAYLVRKLIVEEEDGNREGAGEGWDDEGIPSRCLEKTCFSTAAAVEEGNKRPLLLCRACSLPLFRSFLSRASGIWIQNSRPRRRNRCEKTEKWFNLLGSELAITRRHLLSALSTWQKKVAGDACLDRILSGVGKPGINTLPLYRGVGNGP